MLRKVIPILATMSGIAGSLVVGVAPAHADTSPDGTWVIRRSPSATYCGEVLIASYQNGTDVSVDYRRSVSTTSKVSISATIAGGVSKIESELGYTNEQTVTINETVSLTLAPRTTLNIRTRFSAENWSLWYHSFLLDAYGTGRSVTPVGLCLSTSGVPPLPPP